MDINLHYCTKYKYLVANNFDVNETLNLHKNKKKFRKIFKMLISLDKIAREDY